MGSHFFVMAVIVHNSVNSSIVAIIVVGILEVLCVTLLFLQHELQMNSTFNF